MFLRFVRANGKILRIRAEDFRMLDDELGSIVFQRGESPSTGDSPLCVVYWKRSDDDAQWAQAVIQGSNDENFKRIQEEEFKLALEYEKRQKALPALPVRRG